MHLVLFKIKKRKSHVMEKSLYLLNNATFKEISGFSLEQLFISLYQLVLYQTI